MGRNSENFPTCIDQSYFVDIIGVACSFTMNSFCPIYHFVLPRYINPYVSVVRFLFLPICRRIGETKKFSWQVDFSDLFYRQHRPTSVNHGDLTRAMISMRYVCWLSATVGRESNTYHRVCEPPADLNSMCKTTFLISFYILVFVTKGKGEKLQLNRVWFELKTTAHSTHKMVSSLPRMAQKPGC